MGEQFNLLHPMLQKRYDRLEEGKFSASGMMKRIQSGPKMLFPLLWFGTKFKLLFPESGNEIPFTITNTVYCGSGSEMKVHWERVFYFRKKKRFFNALMSLDTDRMIIRDYLGEPPLFYSDLVFSAVTGGQLSIRSEKQRLVLGKLEIPLPSFFQGLACVTESYADDLDVFRISVMVKNPLVGTIFSYEGEFTADDFS